MADKKFFEELAVAAEKSFFRYGVVLLGERSWCNEAIAKAFTLGWKRPVKIGGKHHPDIETFPQNQGKLFLGKETDFLLIDMSEGYDANSISLLLGTLVGGGIALFQPPPLKSLNLSEIWINEALRKLLVLGQHLPTPPLPQASRFSGDHLSYFSEQDLVIDKIASIFRYSPRKPLVLTADRGRGKSTALGLAAARLLQEPREVSIIVTSSHWSNTEVVLSAAEKALVGSQRIQKSCLINRGSSLRFICPSALISGRVEADILLIDEASSLPLPTLYQVIEQYPRVVLSTTVHGYEGCGRGFMLKFLKWLDKKNFLYKKLHLNQPIRWRIGDPLESWLNRTFFLPTLCTDPHAADNQAANNLDLSSHSIVLEQVSKSELVADPDKMASLFQLLVNSHYQTSPNDLTQILSNTKISIFSFSFKGCVIGCIIVVKEPPLKGPMVHDIIHGRRRPKGYFTSITMANQVGAVEATSVEWHRIMRIAVSPKIQGKGVGTTMLRQLPSHLSSPFISVSFGLSSRLLSFWKKAKFRPVKLGSRKDSCSGCYSLLMVADVPKIKWLEASAERFFFILRRQISTQSRDLPSVAVEALLSLRHDNNTPDIPYFLLYQYTLGGSNFESVECWLQVFWESLPSDLRQQFGSIFVSRVLLRNSWQKCCRAFGLSSRKDVELEIRRILFPIINLFMK